MEKFFFPKEIKDHESLWRIYHHQKSFFFCQSRVMHLIPWNWSVRTRQRSSPVIGQFRMNNIFPFFHEVLGHRRSKKRFLYSMPETKFLQKGFCRETLFA